jgi:hypothetical protein
VGLDAEGTRDLVTDPSTGLLLPMPDGHSTWPSALHDQHTPTFERAALDYANLLAQVCKAKAVRLDMGTRGVDSTRDMSWWEAMEVCGHFLVSTCAEPGSRNAWMDTGKASISIYLARINQSRLKAVYRVSAGSCRGG